VSESFEITVDGRPVQCRAGETIAAALMQTGLDAWRTTRRAGTPRGLFCGIGICFDCLVSINGARPVRACLATGRAGDRIATAPGADPHGGDDPV